MPDKEYCSEYILKSIPCLSLSCYKTWAFFPLLLLSFSVLFQISLQFSLLSQCTPVQHQFVVIEVLEIKPAASCSLEIWSLTNKLVSASKNTWVHTSIFFPIVLVGMQLNKGNQSVLCCLISEEWHWAARVWRWGIVNTEKRSWIPLSSLVSKSVWFINTLQWEGRKSERKGSGFF